MLARAGLGAAEVRAMCHAELTAWLQDLLASMGIHSPTGGEVIVSRRLPKPSAQAFGRTGRSLYHLSLSSL